MVQKHSKRLAKRVLEYLSAARPQHWPAVRIYWSGHNDVQEAGMQNLHAAIEWLKRAQDSSGSGGVARGYLARVPVRTAEQLGWQPAYPETSGYIIETFLRYAKLADDPELAERARRIADWETEIQLPDGGFQGGVIGATPVASSTFVTGQVLFGLLHAYQAFGEAKYANAARRAAEFLLSCLSPSGELVSGYSHFCAPGPKAYEVRTGWALAMFGKIFHRRDAVEGARRMADFALRSQHENGWFATNDLNSHDQPLTHTIGYTLEGLYEIGALLSEAKYLNAVRRSLTSIRPLVSGNGYLAGRWHADWKAAVPWVCLTGSAQIACVCCRMHRHFPEDGWDELGHRLLKFVAGTQPLRESDPGLAGGIAGAYPFNGEYGQYTMLNWAAKFFADGVLDALELKQFNVEANREATPLRVALTAASL